MLSSIIDLFYNILFIQSPTALTYKAEIMVDKPTSAILTVLIFLEINILINGKFSLSQKLL